MQELKIGDVHRVKLQDFVSSLRDIFKEGLISVILYGSAASGEFTLRNSNLNLLIVLSDAGLPNLKKCTALVNRLKYRKFEALFLSREYIQTSTDVFPIEFLDMKENYSVLFGEDVLKGVQVDTRNLRFQCEQELKGKLINLRQAYLRQSRNRAALKYLLFKYCTSVLHILRNVLRVKGKNPSYLKQDVLKEVGDEFKIDMAVLTKILAAKNKEIALSAADIDSLFIRFTEEVEKASGIVDKL